MSRVTTVPVRHKDFYDSPVVIHQIPVEALPHRIYMAFKTLSEKIAASPNPDKHKFELYDSVDSVAGVGWYFVLLHQTDSGGWSCGSEAFFNEYGRFMYASRFDYSVNQWRPIAFSSFIRWWYK